MNILVTALVKEEEKQEFAAIAGDAIFRYKDGYDRLNVTEEDVRWADLVLGNVPAEWIANAEHVQWLQTNSAGVEPYTRAGVLPETARLTNASGAYGLAISEHMLGMLLMIYKKLELYRDAQKLEVWESKGSVRSIQEAVVVVLGMGDIGGAFGKRCKALGAKVIGIRRTNTEKPDYADEVYLTAELDAVLPKADVVAISLPGTAETIGMITRERIAMMKKGAVILNVGRGNIIDTEAMCDALESEELMGVGLDVTDPEPLPKGHRLWQLPTAVITPHVSGFYHLEQTRRNIIGIFKENLKRYLAGVPLINEVDRRAGY